MFGVFCLAMTDPEKKLVSEFVWLSDLGGKVRTSLQLK